MKALRQLHTFLLTLVIATLAVSPIRGAVPDVVNFSGTMSNSYGAIEGAKTVTTTLVAEDETTAVWTQTHSAVDFTDGRFTLQIGEDSTDPLTATDVGGATYLKVEVEGEEGFILFDLTSSFFALSAEHATTADTALSVSWDNVSGKPTGLESIEDTITTNATKLLNRGISTDTPESGEVLQWDGSEWSPTSVDYTLSTASDTTLGGVKIADESRINIDSNGYITIDISGIDTNTTTTNATEIHNRSISSDTPEVGHVLKWDGSEWAPAGDVGGDYTLTKATDTTLGGVKVADESRIDIDSNGFITVDITGIDTDTDTTTTNATLLQQNPLNASSPSSGQILKWNGSEWALASDDTGDAFNSTSLTEDLIPNTTNSIDLGSSSKKFQNAYIQGNAYLNSVAMSSPSLEANSEYYSFPSGETPYHIVMTDIANPTLNSISNLDLAPNNYIFTNPAGDISSGTISPVGQSLIALSTTSDMLVEIAGAAETDQVLQWDGTHWVPGTIESSSTDLSSVSSAIVPNTTDTHNLGSASKRFDNVYSEATYTESLSSPTGTIYSSSIFWANQDLLVNGAFAVNTTSTFLGKISASDIDADGTITANAFIGDGSGLTGIIDEDTTYSAGVGLVLNDTLFNIDDSVVTNNYFGTITANAFVGDGSGLTGIIDEDTTYLPGTGLSLNGTIFDIKPSVVTNNYSGPIVATAFIGDGSGLTGVTAEGTTWTTWSPTISGSSTTVDYARYKIIDGNTVIFSAKFTSTTGLSDPEITVTVPEEPSHVTAFSILLDDASTKSITPMINSSGSLSTFTIDGLEYSTSYTMIINGTYEY